MNDMEQMKYFIKGLKTPMRMFLDASVRGSLRCKNEDEVKELIIKMCQNEYHSTNRIVKPKGIFL